jgi:endoglucanase
MTSSLPRRLAVLGAVLSFASAGLLATATTAAASNPTPLRASTRFFTPPPPPGSAAQIRSLLRSGRYADALAIGRMVTTPQAVWFTSGTPKEVRKAVRTTSIQAAWQRSVPTMVVYNVPGRDCSQYSSGGASSDAAYRSWIDGFAAGLRKNQRVTVIVEPDGLANLPSDCAPGAYPGQDVAALTAGRIADIKYAGKKIMRANPKALVYLDAGHSGWHSVGDMAERLDQAGVRKLQGFSLNVSNYQPTAQLTQYANWVSKCIYFAHNAKANNGANVGNYQGCASQYYPATADDPSTWGLTDAWYATNVDQAAGHPTNAGQLAHAVLDTSRNGQGPWTPAASTKYPDAQAWCNPPGRGLGLRPTADTGEPLIDAYLWIKTPGQSDGQCNRGIAGSTTDPEWGGITDPAAGAWFGQQALELAKLASPPLR